ncbi:M48 family metallopeptidase [Halomonas sp. M5N1S17]|uniref:M48 family metallopeptidase n=1 Tax=Halomonas alkalisoli TaxID=2907158 RepID=UPI001F25E172|nr:M48 family metallopeptidase [Halomonas alkalisoli]MCE9662648.1 M48 family metallopeptidase [Halomonas alkalisoli]
MDFFGAQDQARRLTARLVLLLLVAVAGMVAAAVLIVAVAMALLDGGQAGADPLARAFDPVLLGSVALGVVAVVGLGSLMRHLQLRGGGSAVAEALGGRLINGSTHDADEQRLLNVVEEMAIASGMPVPAVYVLEEPSINAFAAGHAPHDAAIGVTRGAIQTLDRDELQGVVAHEFSHILHGDMRLNMRLVALLYGILVIGLVGRMLLHGMAGRRAVRSSRRGNGHAVMLGAGIALMVVGYVGTLCGNLIKAAVSRQREFLADASAVQYTRNPEGLARALKRLAAHSHGSELRATQAAEFSHLYFGRGLRGLSGLTATHPPLTTRIERLQPDWDGSLPEPRPVADDPAAERRRPGDVPSAAGLTGQAAVSGLSSPPSAAPTTAAHSASITSGSAQGLSRRVGQPGPADIVRARQTLAGLDDRLLEAAHEPYAARALVYGILMGVDPSSRERQRQALVDQALPEVLVELDRLAPPLAAMEPGQRLALIELAMPMLRQLTTAQFAGFRACLSRLMAEEAQPGALQWGLHRIVLVGVEGPRHRRHRRYHLSQLEAPVARLLSSLARAGEVEEAEARDAFQSALQALPIAPAFMSRLASPEELDQAVESLLQLTDDDKVLLLDAMARCVFHDGHIAPGEAEMLRAVAWSLGCPLPATAAD